MTYVFDNAATQAAARLATLATVFDDGTVRHLEARGVAAGWRCLEVGGGGGSIARWLASRVGPQGYVLATDIDPRHLTPEGAANLEVLRHDIVRDPLPAHTFDLAHTRLVLSHLDAPDTAIARMRDSLTPGGWLVLEDFEILHEEAATPGLVPPTMAAMRMVTAAHTDPSLGRTLARRLRQAGLREVKCEARALLFEGGTPASTLLRLNYEQLRPQILATGRVTPQEFEADLSSLDDDAFELRSPLLWTAWGRRSEA